MTLWTLAVAVALMFVAWCGGIVFWQLFKPVWNGTRRASYLRETKLLASLMFLFFVCCVCCAILVELAKQGLETV